MKLNICDYSTSIRKFTKEELWFDLESKHNNELIIYKR